MLSPGQLAQFVQADGQAEDLPCLGEHVPDDEWSDLCFSFQSSKACASPPAQAEELVEFVQKSRLPILQDFGCDPIAAWYFSAG